MACDVVLATTVGVDTGVGTGAGGALVTCVADDPDCIAAENRLATLLGGATQIDPADKAGLLTRVGRAFTKASEVFGPSVGGVAQKNQDGLNALAKILSDPGTTVGRMPGGDFAGGLVFVSPDGIGAVFGPDGTFQYFGWMK